ncbi:MAG: sulfurtransferase TusA family protein [Methylophilaceae bacterium]
MDVRGLACPLPVVRTRKALDSLQPGKILKILTTDRGAASDFESFARQSDFGLLATGEHADEYHFFFSRDA